jgi:hypothetical protein
MHTAADLVMCMHHSCGDAAHDVYIVECDYILYSSATLTAAHIQQAGASDGKTQLALRHHHNPWHAIIKLCTTGGYGRSAACLVMVTTLTPLVSPQMEPASLCGCRHMYECKPCSRIQLSSCSSICRRRSMFHVCSDM